MATTKADAEYLERMLRLHPWRDAVVIVAERAAHLKARKAVDAGAHSREEPASAPEAPVPNDWRILPAGWHEQEREIKVPLRPGQTGARERKIPWWLWWVGLTLLANVLRSVLTSNR